MSNSTLSADALELNEGTTAFMFVSTAMVQFMTPGLALFYGGLVGNNSVISVMFQSYMSLATVFLLWVLCGFSLGFGEPLITVGGYGLLGNPSTYFMLQGVSVYEPLQRAGSVVASGFPGILFMAYQGMFAVITPALIVGSFIDRLRFGPSVVFTALWLLIVYCPLAFWNWGGGWMAQVGAWDFAGGMVVHESSGFSALAAIYLLGRRRYEKDQVGSAFFRKPHNIPFVLTGTAMLWFGWFGFNGGSALAIGGLATIAFVNTQIAPAVAMLTWVFLDWTVKLKYSSRKPTLLGACSGAVCGLVVITPCAGFVQPHMAMVAGVTGALICWSCTYMNVWYSGLDDACDTVSIHGLGGFLGTIYVGIMSDPPECASDNPPRWCANPHTCTRTWDQVRIQTICAFVSAGYAVTATYVILKIFFALGIAKLTRHDEQFECQDWQEFGEVAYRRSEPEGPYEYVPMDASDTESDTENTDKRSLSIAMVEKDASAGHARPNASLR